MELGYQNASFGRIIIFFIRAKEIIRNTSLSTYRHTEYTLRTIESFQPIPQLVPTPSILSQNKIRRDSRNTRKVTWLCYNALITQPIQPTWTGQDIIKIQHATTVLKQNARKSTSLYTVPHYKNSDTYQRHALEHIWKRPVEMAGFLRDASIIQMPKQSKTQKLDLKGSTGQRRRIQAPGVILIHVFLTTLQENKMPRAFKICPEFP